ncbi:hypothetical protein ALP29_04886, partial [Pseudomonas syringae pv. avii]
MHCQTPRNLLPAHLYLGVNRSRKNGLTGSEYMGAAPCISQIASLLAEPKRTAMLWALMDGSAKSSDELAALAGLSPASANAHLARLTGSGLLRIEARRGQRLF